LCAEITGNVLQIGSESGTRPGDVPLYLSDCTRLSALSAWRPSRDARRILDDIHAWITEHESELAAVL
jgi:CDP-paratose 2-epimerase